MYSTKLRRWGIFSGIIVAAILVGAALIVRGAVKFWLQADNASIQSISHSDSSLSFHLDTIHEGDKINHTFQIENTETIPLTVEKVSVSCGCTVVDTLIVGKTFGPGEQLAVPVSIDLTGKQGEISSSVFVFARGRSKPFECRVFGEIVVEYPKMVDFGAIKKGEAQVHNFTLLPPEGLAAYEVESLLFDKKVMDVEATRSKDGSHKIQVALAEDLPYGYLNERLTIITNESRSSRKVINITASVLRPVEANPKELYLGINRESQNTESRVRLESPYKKPISVRGIDLNRPELYKCVELATDDNCVKEYLVSLVSSNHSDNMELQKGDIVFHVDFASGETYDVRVEVYSLDGKSS